MTLVVDARVDGPRIHVLAVGVGGYRYLPGGAGHDSSRETLGLRQLSGPPLSARAFVEFVTRRLRHPVAALATVELLLSPAQDWAGTPVDVPDTAHVVSAFDAWYARCDRSEDDVGLFFFCGHGVERESPFLLLEDFAADRKRLLDNAVDISLTVRGMSACAAGTQYFFVDACRDVPHALLERLNGTARVLVDLPPGGENRDCALLLATSGGNKAYGARGRPTRFTEALIGAWGGLGARQDGASWVVEFGGLQSAVTSLLRRTDPAAPRQLPQSFYVAGNAALHVCDEPPTVSISLSCRPPSALADPGLTASLTSFDSPDPLSLVAEGSGWRAEVPADLYRFEVVPQPPYRSGVQRIPAWPPFCDLPVSVLP